MRPTWIAMLIVIALSTGLASCGGSSGGGGGGGGGGSGGSSQSDKDLISNMTLDGINGNVSSGITTFGWEDVNSGNPVTLFSPPGASSGPCPISGSFSVSGSETFVNSKWTPNITFTFTNCRWLGTSFGTSDLTMTSGSVLMTGTIQTSPFIFDTTYTSSNLSFTGTVDGVAKSGTACSINITNQDDSAGVHSSGTVCGNSIVVLDAGPGQHLSQFNVQTKQINQLRQP